MAQENNVEFFTKHNHHIVHSDAIMLERILSNLITNAIRYTPKGRVWLGSRRRGDKLRIEVRDNGVGIAEDKLDEIFKEFYQVDNPERDRNKGLGLGLAIVDRLSRLLDHPLSVRTRPGQGSVFAVEIPLLSTPSHNEDTPPAATAYTADVSGMQVLVIDDEAVIRSGMFELLSDWNCNVMLADGTDGAIDQLIQQATVPDLIVSDFRLRDNDNGIQAIKRIHAHCETDIPAIIITGDTAPERIQEIKNSGYQVLHKPVTAAKLRSLMAYLRAH